MKNDQKENFIGQLKEEKKGTWKQAKRKTEQLAVGPKESLVLQFQEMCFGDKNQEELEQLTPVKITKEHHNIYVCVCVSETTTGSKL